MGVDLRLLPIDYLTGEPDSPWGASFTILSVPRTRALLDDIIKLPTENLPENHRISAFTGKRVPDGSCEGESMYGRIRDRDSYGCEFTWIDAGMLVPAFERHLPTEPVTAYLKALPPTSKIILDWH